MLNIIPKTNIDFMKYRWVFLGFSALLSVITIVLFFTKGLDYGIDFRGGAEVQIKITEAWDIGRLRTELEAGGLEGLRVQKLGEGETHEYMIRAEGDEKSINAVAAKVEGVLAKGFKAGEYEILKSDVVGPSAGKSLKKQGALALFYSLLVIFIYITIRFDARYAPGGIVALLHDALITTGVYIVVGREFDLTTLAAILALMGYSINDTVVVFDRVREVMHAHPNWDPVKIVNLAVNETLSRTIITGITTFFVVFCLYIYGGGSVENFAFAFLVGLVFGTYSSIFVASAIFVWQAERRQRKLQAASGAIVSKKKKVARPEPKLQA